MEKYRLRTVSTYFQRARGKAPCTYINKVPSLQVADRLYFRLYQSKVKWGTSMRRFGRGKYDHGLVSAISDNELQR